jgi:hypothetical protein
MKRICIIFAGREDRMSILMEYLKKAIDKNYINEIHIWDHCRAESDREWLKTLQNERTIIRPAVDFFSVYEYYKNSDDLFMKLDDDIVYLNIEKIPELFEFLQQKTDEHVMFVSPICMNNPIHYNLTNVPSLLGHTCDTVIDTMADTQYLNDLHTLFCTKFEKVKSLYENVLINTPWRNTLRTPKMGNSVVGHSIGCVWGVEYQGYIPINTIFFKKNFCKYITENMTNKYDDETTINFPRLDASKYMNFIYPVIFGSHLSFGGQVSDKLPEWLDMYKNLSKKINNV